MNVTNCPPHECVDCIHYMMCPCQWEFKSEACFVIAKHYESGDFDETDIHLQNH